MKKTIIAMIVIIGEATLALGSTAYMYGATKDLRWTRPDAVVNPVTKQEHANPSDATLAQAGWTIAEYEDCDLKYRVVGWDPPTVRAMTQAERETVDNAEAEDVKQAEAMDGPDPEWFVPALDDDGNKVGTARIVVRAATWEVVPLTNEASPKRVWLVQRDEYKTRIARADAMKNRIKDEKAKGNGNAALIGRVSALEAKEGVE